MTLTIILLAFMLGVGVVNLIVNLTLSNKVDKYMADRAALDAALATIGPVIDTLMTTITTETAAIIAALAALAPVAEDFSSEVQTITDAVSRINGAATAVSAELPPTS